jgi:hypothetical protein
VIRRVPLHPLLWAAWPPLSLWGANWRLVNLRDAVPVLGGVLVLTALGWSLTAVAGLGWRRAAIVATVLTICFQLVGFVPGGSLTTVTISAIAVVAVVLWSLKVSIGTIVSATFILNVAGVLGVLLAVGPGASAEIRGQHTLHPPRLEVPADAEQPERDVVYIIPDRFGRADVLAESYDWESGAFITALEERGFAVATESAANYPKTAHSMASAWNLGYLDEIVVDVPSRSQQDLRLLYPLLREHQLGRLATTLGYDYLHLGNWWHPTASASTASEVLTRTPVTQFSGAYLDRTVVPGLVDLLPGASYEFVRERHRAHAEHGLAELAARASDLQSSPRFILAHLALPHEPYVFDRDGSWVPEALEAKRTLTENYVRQLEYTETELLKVIDSWLERPPSDHPIIVLQADEGPHPRGLLADPDGYRWVDADVDEQREKLAILTALFLPGSDRDVPETLSPVNTFRLVLDIYHGTDFGLLPDRSSVYISERELYRFEDVTHVVR